MDEFSWRFFDYRRTDGLADQHDLTSGDLILAAGVQLRFHRRLKKYAQPLGPVVHLKFSATPGAGESRITLSKNLGPATPLCEFSLQSSDAEEFSAAFVGVLNQHVEIQANVSRWKAQQAEPKDQDGVEAPGFTASALSSLLGVQVPRAITIGHCDYAGGYSGHPKPSKASVLSIKSEGLCYGGFKELFCIPWSSVAGLRIEGPEQAAKRVTATRLAAIGVFAVAAPKSSKSALLIADLKSGEQAIFHTTSLTSTQLRIELAPITSQLSRH